MSGIYSLAVTGVAMNLPDQDFRPIVSVYSPLKPSLTELAAQRLPKHHPRSNFRSTI
jgi:hypothetical protein